MRLTLAVARRRFQRLRDAVTHLRRRRVRRWLLGAAFGLVAGCCLLLALGLALARADPSWWRTVQRDDPTFIDLGERVEKAVFNRVACNRGQDAWTVALKPEEANAWLNVRLPKWLANQKDDFHWPRDVSDIQVDFESGLVIIGAKVHAGGRDQVLTATLEPRLDDAGRLFLPARYVNLGRLSIPADWVLDRAAADQYIPRDLQALPETDALINAFSKGDAVLQQALFRLGDGRRVRILSIAPEDGLLRVTCRTELQ
jgi:hypothetical protein